MLVSLLTAAAFHAAAQIPPPPVDALSEAQRTRFVSFVSGPVTCGGARIAPTAIEQPRSTLTYTAIQFAKRVPAITLTFAIDAGGRPIDIVDKVQERGGMGFDTSDIAPALAAWQFPRGAAQHGCRVTFTVEDPSLAEAPRRELTRYYITMPIDDPNRRRVFEQLRPADASCYDPTFPMPLMQVLPDPATIPQRAGTLGFAMIAFAIDHRGKPRDAHIETSTGNAVLEAKALRAMRRWRFPDGARQGCLFPFVSWTREPLEAPPPPDVAAYRPADADCPGRDEWARYPEMIYPQPFRRRSIEGWAIVRYDVASWGQLGNFAVLASEPAAAFGREAIAILETARKPPSKRGLYGCVQLVKFDMDRSAGR